MKVLLDTDICIYAINRRTPGPLERLRAYSLGDVGISPITYAALRFGVENSGRAAENLERLERFLLPLALRQVFPRAFYQPVSQLLSFYL